MKMINKQSYSLAIAALLLVAWSAVILLLGNVTRLGIYGWISFLFVPVCLITIAICTVFYNPVKNDSSAIAIPVHYSAIFLILAISINAVFILLGITEIGPFVMTIDVLLLVAYCIIAIFGNLYLHRLTTKTQKVENNTAFSTSVSRELGTLLAQIDEPELHRTIAMIKEDVDFSTNSTQGTYDETIILSKLNTIKEAVVNKTDPSVIQTLITEFSALWNSRNSRL